MPNDIDAVESPAPAAPITPPVEPNPPQAQRAGLSPAWMASSAVMMITGAVIALGVFFLARGFAAPPPPGQITGSDKDALSVTPEQVKAIADRLDQAKADLEALSKKVDTLDDPDPAIKGLRDDLDTLSRNVVGLPAQIDSLSQKLETLSKVQTEAPSPKIDELTKKLSDLAQQVDALRAPVVKPVANATKPPEDLNVQGEAMGQAADLFEAKEYAKARDAFVKLQAVYPTDARVWYYSALANGLATNQWTGDTEKWVNMGMEKEKADSPSADRIDALFKGLTPATGKDWLAAYRARIVRK